MSSAPPSIGQSDVGVSLVAWAGENGHEGLETFRRALKSERQDKVSFWVGNRRKSGVASPAEPPLLHVALFAGLEPPEGFPDAAAPTWTWSGECILGDERPVADAQGLMCNFADIGPTDDEEFNAWYDTEHIPFLGQHPALLAGRRYRATTGVPRYLALYHLADAEAAQTEAWSQLVKTPWGARMIPRRSHTDRLLLRRMD